MDGLVENAEMHRFELPVGDDLAVSYYQEQDGRIVLLHTEVPQQLSGQGVGSRLIKGALEQARARKLKVASRCPFVGAYLGKHPEFNDLIA